MKVVLVQVLNINVNPIM